MATLYKRGESWYLNYSIRGRRKRGSLGSNEQLAQYLKSLDHSESARFMVTEIKKGHYFGWLPEEAWKYIDKYSGS
jgi:hypothetical protein